MSDLNIEFDNAKFDAIKKIIEEKDNKSTINYMGKEYTKAELLKEYKKQISELENQSNDFDPSITEFSDGTYGTPSSSEVDEETHKLR